MTRSRQAARTRGTRHQASRRALAIVTMVAIAGAHSVLAQAGPADARVANAAPAAERMRAVTGSSLRSAVQRDAIEIAHGRLTLDFSGGTASIDPRDGQTMRAAQQ